MTDLQVAESLSVSDVITIRTSHGKSKFGTAELIGTRELSLDFPRYFHLELITEVKWKTPFAQFFLMQN